jgi:hypothetical protein
MLSASSAIIEAASSLLRRAGSVAYLAVLRTKFEADFVAAVVLVAVDGVRVVDFSLSFKIALFGAVLNINKL